jgi:hypothetical protein
MKNAKEIEMKNIIQNIVNGLMKVISLDAFRGKISQFIAKEYAKGMEAAEIKFDMNFVPSNTDVGFLQQYVNQNVENVADDIGRSLRGELSRGIISGEDLQKLKRRVKDVFKEKKFTNRLKAVIRTEKIRANNYGSLQGAKQSQLPLRKYVSIINDNRTSHICLQEERKYGSPGKSIPLKDEFVVRVDNKTIRAQAPPFHPNCRTIIKYVKEEDFKKDV